MKDKHEKKNKFLGNDRYDEKTPCFFKSSI